MSSGAGSDATGAGGVHAAGSGDRAVAAAVERAKATAARNIPAFDDLPVPADTANLREGADLNNALLALLPLVGVWRGEGEGRGPDGDYRFGQQIVVSHDGGDYLNWESRSGGSPPRATTRNQAYEKRDSGGSSPTRTIRASLRRSSCYWRIRPVMSNCSTGGRAPSPRGSW